MARELFPNLGLLFLVTMALRTYWHLCGGGEQNLGGSASKGMVDLERVKMARAAVTELYPI